MATKKTSKVWEWIKKALFRFSNAALLGWLTQNKEKMDKEDAKPEPKPKAIRKLPSNKNDMKVVKKRSSKRVRR